MSDNPKIVSLDYRLTYEQQDGDYALTRNHIWVEEGKDKSSFISLLLRESSVTRVWVEKHQYPFMQTEGSGSLGEPIYLKGKYLG